LHACGRDKELAAVKISAADVQLIAREVEVDPKVADRRLRESGGNVFNALVSFL
jgi:NACalpha-BTF3-like transcription factor